MKRQSLFFGLLIVLLFTSAIDLYGRPVAAKKLRLKSTFHGIRGRVTKSVATGETAPPLKYVDVAFKPIHAKTVLHCETDKNGYFKKSLPKGAYFVTVSKSGYKTVTTKPKFVRVEGSVTKNFELRRVPGGFRGTVYQALEDGKKGAPIKSAPLTFIKKNSGDVVFTMADENGKYAVWLQPGAYEVRCKDKHYFHQRVPNRLVIAKDEKKITKDLLFKRKPPRLKLKITNVIGYIWERTGPYTSDDLIGPVKGVEVIFTNKKTNKQYSGKCTANGNHYQLLLPMGDYHVTLKKAEFLPMDLFTYDIEVDEPQMRFDWYMVKDLRHTIK